MKKTALFALFLITLIACQTRTARQPEPAPPPATGDRDIFLPGIDRFLRNYTHLVENKRVGLVTNPSGVDRNLQYTSDLLHADPRINLTAFYGPEHGIRGNIHAGMKIGDMIDEKTGIPVYSLYGNRRKPTAETLADVDVLIVDIQDIGLRGYTYIYTMGKVMEAAAEHGKKVLVLDRPNPIGGLRVEGNLVEEGFFSFVGLYPIPYQHGMTIGELALLFNSEYGIGCDLEVIPMAGWHREMYWEDTGLSWVPTSPHVPHWKTILYMGATGTFGELRVLSEGVGYTSPFELVGAPWIDREVFAAALNQLNLPGIYFRPLHFKPYYLHYPGENLQGVQLHITDTRSFAPYRTGLFIMQEYMRLYPYHDLFSREDRLSMFNKVMGTDRIMKMFQEGMPVEDIEAWWQPQLNAFKKTREQYLLY